jgi:hypothetical protein
MKKIVTKTMMVLGIFTIIFVLSGCPDPADAGSPVNTDIAEEQTIAAGITNTGVIGYVKMKGRDLIPTPPPLEVIVSPADNPLIVEKCYKFEIKNPPIPGTYKFTYNSNDYGSCYNGGTNWIALRPLHCGKNLYLSITTPSSNGNIYTYYFGFEAKYGDIKKPVIILPPGPFKLGKLYVFRQPYIDLRATYDIIHSAGFVYGSHGWNEGGYCEVLKAVKPGWHWVQAVAKTKECSWQEEKSDRYWVFIC